MALSQNLIDQFTKIVNSDNSKKEETIINGTFKKLNGYDYVQLDGSNILTPVTLMVEATEGERVKVLIKDHTAMVTGNISSPAARNKTVEELNGKVDANGNSITQMDNMIKQQNNKITQLGNNITEVNNNITEVNNTINSMNNIITQQGNKITQQDNVITQQGNTIKQNSDNIISVGNTVTQQGNTITQQGNTIKQQGNTIEQQGNVINSHGNSIDAFDSDIKILNSGFKIENGKLTGLSEIVTDELKTNTLDTNYANIDFANITMAAVGKLFADSGIIKDLIVGDQKITGELVGVTLKGDLIEGNTIKADKLVVKGTDGLYYKLNVNSLGEAVASSDPKYQNGLDGSNIVAKSLTAEKIAVDDLVAFDATIGGFNITKNSIYSGAKQSVDNTTKGIYMDNIGQLSFGDNENFLKYYLDKNDNKWKMELSAESIKMSFSDKTVNEQLNDLDTATKKAVKKITVLYGLSNGSLVPPVDGWSEISPPWEKEKYMWQKTKTEYVDGTISESKPTCIQGAKGENGQNGQPGKDGVDGTNGKDGAPGKDGQNGQPGKDGTNGKSSYQIWLDAGNTGTEQDYLNSLKGKDGANGTNGKDGVDGTNGKDGAPGKDGTPGKDGENGKSAYQLWLDAGNIGTEEDYINSLKGQNGEDGKGIVESIISYQISENGTDIPQGEWHTTVQETTKDKPYLWTKTYLKYSDGTYGESYSVGSTIAGVDDIIQNTNNKIDETNKQVEQNTQNIEKHYSEFIVNNQNLKYALTTNGGSNLIKNSDMAKGQQFWKRWINQLWYETPYTPSNPKVGDYWYCTESHGSYIAGQMYYYNSSGWKESPYSRKQLEAEVNWEFVRVIEDADSRKKTLSGRYLNFDLSKIDTHLFCLTNMIDYKEEVPSYSMSFKIDNHVKTGCAYILLAWYHETAEELEVGHEDHQVEAMYLQDIVLTPDDMNELGEVKLENLKNVKKEDFIEVNVSTTTPSDTSKQWLDTSMKFRNIKKIY